jgi:DNA-binding MarR family transcriptional regulator
MSEFHARPLDAHEVSVVAVLAKFTDEISVTKLTRRVSEPALLTRAEIYGAIDRLEADGYIIRRTRPYKIRCYRLNEARRGTIETQVTLQGALDVYDLDDWVLAAMWRSSACSHYSALSAQWFDSYLNNVWGKFVSSDVLASCMARLTFTDRITQATNSPDARFYASHHQRKKILNELADFPLMPGYLPPDPAALTAQLATKAPDVVAAHTLAEDVYQWVLAAARPVKVREVEAAQGVNVVQALEFLLKTDRIGRMEAQDAIWDSEDVVWATGAPFQAPVIEEVAPLPQTTVFHPTYGTLQVYKLSPDEVKVLKEAMKRVNAFGPFIISKKLFGDTSDSYPNYSNYTGANHQSAKEAIRAVKLRAQPALVSLAKKGLILGDSTYEKGTWVDCRHDNLSTYRCRPMHRAMAQYSLELTTGQLHCKQCGEVRLSPDVLCERCRQAEIKTKVPAPGVQPIQDPDDIKALHAVYEFGLHHYPARYSNVGAFAYRTDSEFDVAKAHSFQHHSGPLDHARAARALQRLERAGYVTRHRGKYRLSTAQRQWVLDTYVNGPGWPHVAQATALQQSKAEAQSATTYTARAGRAIELD